MNPVKIISILMLVALVFSAITGKNLDVLQRGQDPQEIQGSSGSTLGFGKQFNHSLKKDICDAGKNYHHTVSISGVTSGKLVLMYRYASNCNGFSSWTAMVFIDREAAVSPSITITDLHLIPLQVIM